MKNFKSSSCKIIRSYNFGKKRFKIAEVEIFGNNQEYLRFAVDIEVKRETSELIGLASKFITIETGKDMPELITVDEPELVLNFIKDIREDTDDTQTRTN